MVFILSKLAGFLLEPLAWLVLLALLAFLYRNRPRGKKFLFWLVVTGLFFTNDFISNLALRAWNKDPIPLDSLTQTYDYVVVLGGFTILDQQPDDRVYLNQAADRLMHSLLLYRKGIAKKIVLSGGTGSLRRLTNQTEAANASELLGLCEVPAEDILLDTASRNTYENALNSMALIRKQGKADPSIIVVTSAFHAKRSWLCFRKMGVDVPIMTTDLRTHSISFMPDTLLIPNSEALSRWSVLFHEWAGLAGYWVAGYISVGDAFGQ